MIKESSEYLKLVENSLDLDKFLYLTDEYILNKVIDSSSPKLAKAKKHGINIYIRKLPKMIEEKIVYLKNGEINHKGGVEIENENMIWKSRILSNDFSKDFTKFNIHIKKHTGKLIPFSEYWENNYPNWNKQIYYIKRVYSY